jgi:hydroxyacylglutathione hydrolase
LLARQFNPVVNRSRQLKPEITVIVGVMKTLHLKPIPALSDNYIWLLHDDLGNALVVDPGQAEPVLAELSRQQLELRAILLTHHHPDHIGGVETLVKHADISIHAPQDPRIGLATHRVVDGDHIHIAAPECAFEVIGVPGHTSSHIAFHGGELLFSGDTLFSVGCGRLFEGTPEQMLSSLERLAMLAGNTRVCCGHEYTLANCAFAQSVEPDNPALEARFAAARRLRAEGKPTLPSLISEERACNPFLRIDEPGIVEFLQRRLPAGSDRISRFAALRQLKDSFRA